ncbi:MAG: discoidin domain-containing protein [Candidatus Zipacnadales bacterium]
MRVHHPTIATVFITVGLSLAGSPRATSDFVCGAVNIVAAENGGRVLSASSEPRERGKIRPEWRKENLIDGLHVQGDIVPTNSHGWATQTAPSPRSPAWVVFAFADERPRLLGSVRLDPVTSDPQVIGRWVKNFRIEVSVTTPEGPWEMVESHELLNIPRPQDFKFRTPTLAKYVRLVITSNHGSNFWVSLGEFEVYEALLSTDELTRIIDSLERELGNLKRFAAGSGASQSSPEPPLPDLGASLIAAANGGQVVAVSSERLAEGPTATGSPGPREEWRATNLIDGLIFDAEEPPPHRSFGWSSEIPPRPNKPEFVIFQVSGDTPVLVDAALVDPRTCDPWTIGRGAKEIEIATSIVSQEGPWHTVGRWELPQEPAVRVLHFPPSEARFVRLLVISNHGSDRYVGLGEFGVYRLSKDVNILEGIALEFENIITNLKLYYQGALAKTIPPE